MRLDLRWRLISVIALVVYAVLAVVVGLLLLHNIGFWFVFGITLAVLAYAFWALLIEGTSHRWLAFTAGIVGLLALVAEVGFFVFAQHNVRVVVAVMLAAALYLSLFALIRQSYRQAVRSSTQPKIKAAHFKRPYLIINPRSGNGRATKAHVPELATAQGINVLFTRPQTDVGAIARQAAESGADVLGISGGDGSLGAVAAVAIANNLPVVILPGGTKCHLARDLGLKRERITDSLAAFQGVERRIDVAEINGRVFVNNASFGLYADFVSHPEYREHKVEVATHILEDIARGAKEPYDLHFHHDDLNATQAVEVMVGVNEYNIVNLLNLGHRDKLDGGVLQVTAVTNTAESTGSANPQTNRHEPAEYKDKLGIYQWTDKTFQLSNENSHLVVAVDGEREIYQNPVTIRILPAALRVVVPMELRRGGPSNPLSFAGVGKVWQVAAGGHD